MKQKHEIKKAIFDNYEVSNMLSISRPFSALKKTITTMRNWKTILPVFALFIAFGCSDGNKKYNFEQIGYYKSENKTRVFTFFINTQEQLNRDSIPDDLWTAIQGHGKNQMYTQGKQTQSFYYLDRANTPDVTLLKSYDTAINSAYNNKPLAVVSQDMTGVHLIKKPEE